MYHVGEYAGRSLCGCGPSPSEQPIKLPFIKKPLSIRLGSRAEMMLTSQNRDLVAHFLAFANPTRLRILQRVAQTGEISVNELADHLRMSQPRISWHLRTL